MLRQAPSGPWWQARAEGAEWWRPRLTASAVLPASAVEPAPPDGAVPFWGLMLFTVILLTAPQVHVPALAPFRIALITAVGAIVAHALQRWHHGQPITVRSREVGIAAVLVSWAVVTVPFSYWPGGSLSFLMGAYFKTLAIFWLLANVVSTLRRLRWIVWGLTLGSVPMALGALHNFSSGAFLADGPAVKRIFGYEAPLTENPNDLALMLNLILPMAVALFLSTRHVATRILLVAIMALDAIAIMLTFSRAGFLTFASMLLMYLWRLRHRAERRWMLTGVVLTVAALPLLPSSYWNRLSTIVDFESDPTGSAQSRWSDSVAATGFAARSTSAKCLPTCRRVVPCTRVSATVNSQSWRNRFCCSKAAKLLPLKAFSWT